MPTFDQPALGYVEKYVPTTPSAAKSSLRNHDLTLPARLRRQNRGGYPATLNSEKIKGRIENIRDVNECKIVAFYRITFTVIGKPLKKW